MFIYYAWEEVPCCWCYSSPFFNTMPFDIISRQNPALLWHFRLLTHNIRAFAFNRKPPCPCENLRYISEHLQRLLLTQSLDPQNPKTLPLIEFSHHRSARGLFLSITLYFSPGPLCDYCDYYTIQQRPDYHSVPFKAISISPITEITFKAYEFSTNQLTNGFKSLISDPMDFEIKIKAFYTIVDRTFWFMKFSEKPHTHSYRLSKVIEPVTGRFHEISLTSSCLIITFKENCPGRIVLRDVVRLISPFGGVVLS